MNAIPIHIQYSAFYAVDNGQPLSPSRALVRLSPILDDFDDEPEMLPGLDQILPANVPFLVLKRREGTETLQIARDRVSLIFGSLGWIPAVSDDDSLLENVTELLDKPIIRLALVRKLFLELDEGASFLTSRFANADSISGPFRNSMAFEVHNHKQFTPSEWGEEVNSWVRLRAVRSATSNIDGTSKHGVMIEQDINTLVENTEERFSPSDVSRFAAVIVEEMSEVLRVYFPNDEIELGTSESGPTGDGDQ